MITFWLLLMGFLAPRLLFRPPINMSRNFLAHISAKSHLTLRSAPHSFGTLGQILKFLKFCPAKYSLMWGKDRTLSPSQHTQTTQTNQFKLGITSFENFPQPKNIENNMFVLIPLKIMVDNYFTFVLKKIL